MLKFLLVLLVGFIVYRLTKRYKSKNGNNNQNATPSRMQRNLSYIPENEGDTLDFITETSNKPKSYSNDDRYERKFPLWYGNNNIVGACFRVNQIPVLAIGKKEYVNYKTDRYALLFGRGHDCSYFPGYGKIYNRVYDIWSRKIGSQEKNSVIEYKDIGVVNGKYGPFFADKITNNIDFDTPLEKTNGYKELFTGRDEKNRLVWYAGLKDFQFTGIITGPESEEKFGGNKVTNNFIEQSIITEVKFVELPENVEEYLIGCKLIIQYTNIFGGADELKIEIENIAKYFDNDDYIINAFCIEINKHNTFLFNLISKVIDIETNESFESMYEFVMSKLNKNPQFKLLSTINLLEDELNVLIYAAKSDGYLRKRERDVIALFISSRSDNSLTTEEISEHLKGSDCSYHHYIRSLNKVAKKDIALKQDIMIASKSIIYSDKTTTPAEESILAQIESKLS